MDGEELGLIEDSSGGGEGTAVEEEPSGQETPAEGEEEAPEPEGEGSAEREAPGEEGERGRAERTLPTQLRKALREFVTANPDFGKKYPGVERQVADALFKQAQLGKLGGLQALRTASELIEQHGGAEGIAELAEAHEASEMMQEGIAKGDPVFINVWAQESPEGFAAAAPAYLEKLESVNPVKFDVAISYPMVKVLSRCGVFDVMGDLKAAIAGENAEEVHRHFAALETYFRNLQDYASRSKAPDPLQTQRDEFAAEREQFASERVKAWYGDVRTEVNHQMMAAVNQALRQELAGKKVRIETGNRIRKQINEDLAEAVNTSPGYKERYEAVIKARDREKAVRFIVAAARQKLPGVVKRVLRDFNLAGTAGAGLRRAASSGLVRRDSGTAAVTGRPKTAEVDFNRTDKTAWLGSLTLGHGEAWLRNGKKAKW